MGNNEVIKLLEQEGAEVISPDFMGFIKFVCTQKITNYELLKTDIFEHKKRRNSQLI